MLCKKPYVQGSTPFGCGQCQPCRYNRRRLWSHRIFLETLSHKYCSFVTLTYSKEFLPSTGTLEKRDLQLFLKRLRKCVNKIRFFGVGEYGDLSARPHYHLAIFGMPGCARFKEVGQSVERSKCDCPSCFLIRREWGMGRTDNAHLTRESAQYLAGYVTKKLTSENDFRLWRGICRRQPEFARMSNRPGIGALSVAVIAEQMNTDAGIDYFNLHGDVPDILQHGRKKWPLGRYLRSKIRGYMGLPDTKSPVELQRVWKEECRQIVIEEMSKVSKEKRTQGVSVKSLWLDRERQKVLNFEAKQRLYKKEKRL